MPVFEVTDPSGRKFRVEGPPGSTAEQALEQVRNSAAPNPAPAPSNPDSIPLRTPEGGDAGSIDVLRPFPAPAAPGAGGTGSAVALGRSTAGLPSPRPEQGDFAAGVNSGLLNMDATFFGLAGLVGDSIGSDGLRDWGLQNYKLTSEAAGRVAPRVQGIDQIKSLGDFFDAAQGWIGASTPFLATSLVGGGAGGLVGRAVARRAVERMAVKGVDKAVAEKAVEAALKSPQAQAKILSAIKRGALAGSGAASALSQQGDLYAQLKEAGIEDAAAPAWIFGGAQGALDVIPEAMVLKKLLPGQVEQELNKSLLRGLAGTVGKQAAVEGATEGAQQALSSLARIVSGGADWNDKDTQDLLTNVAAGAVVGSVLGGAAELASKVTAKPAAPGNAPQADESGNLPDNVTPIRPVDPARSSGNPADLVGSMGTDEDIIARRQAKEDANVLEHLDTPEKILASKKDAVERAQRGEPVAWLNMEKDQFGGLKATPRQKMEMRNLQAQFKAAKRGPEPEVQMSFNPNDPAFDLSNDLPAQDWSKLTIDQVPDLPNEQKLSYLQWLNRNGDKEQQQAYEQKFAAGPASEFQMEDLQNATVVGKNGSIEDSANSRGSIPGRAEPWASIARAEENALTWGQSDLDADYFARRVNAPEGARLGLRPGVYVFAVPKVAAEVVATRTGGQRTRGQTARAGIARAREKWDGLPRDVKAQNDVPGAPKYGVPFHRTDAKGTTEVMLDAREITRLGLEVEPDLAGVKNTGERLSRAFWAGMSQIMDTEVGGARYVPKRTMKDNKTSISGNVVLQERKNGSQITLGAARRAYAAASQAGESSAVSPGRELPNRDEEIARDKPETDVPRSAQLRPATYVDPQTGERKPIKPSPGSPAVLEHPGESADERPDRGMNPAIDDIPVAERGQQGAIAEQQGVRPPTSDTEARQNARSIDQRPTTSKLKSSLHRAVDDLVKLLGFTTKVDFFQDLGELDASLKERGLHTDADAIRVFVANTIRGGNPVNAMFKLLADGTYVTYVAKNNDTVTAVKRASHEIGHAYYREFWKKASPETKAAVKDAFKRDKARYLAQHEHALKWTEAKFFDEWMADQLAGWVAKNRAPQSVFEKFLDDIIKSFKHAWALITKQYPVTQEFEQFVREATALQDTKGSSFDALGMHSEPTADEATSLGDKRLSDHVALFREKHPKVDNVMDFTAKVGKTAWDSVLASLQGRIRRMNIPAFNSILSHFDYRPGEKGGHTYYTEADLRMQHFVHQYEKIIKGLKKEEINQIHQEMLLERGVENLKGPLREKATQIRQFFNRLYQYQRNAHLPIQLVENYFPAVGDKEQLGQEDAVDTISQALTANGIKHKREDVVDIVSSMLEDSFVNNFDPAAVNDVAGNSSSPFVQALRTRVLDPKWRDAIRSVKDKDGNARFYAKDMGEVMFRYISQAVRRSEYNRRLGDTKWDTNEVDVDETGKPRGFDPHFELKRQMNIARQGGASADEQMFMYEALSAFMGTHGRIKTEVGRKMINGMMAYQNLRTMSLVLLSSFPDLANNFVRTGNFKDTWNSIVGGWKQAWKATEERDSLLRLVGHAQDIGDQTLLASMQSWWDSPTSTSAKISQGFFRAVGMHRWSSFTKALGARVSVDYINRHAVGAAGGNQDSIARLEELGITATDVAIWNASKQPGYGMPGWTEEDAKLGTASYDSPAQLEAVKRVTGGLSRMVNEIHVNAKPPEKTLWGNAETMKLVFHLKSFMYGFASRILSRVWYDISKEGATTGDKAAAIAGLAMTLPLAALGLELKDWLQNGLWGRESGLKDKSGWEYTRLVVNRSGALGIATMGLDVGDAASNGRAPLVAIAGPTISQMNDVLQYGLYHSAAGAVPVLSSFPGWRDTIRNVGDDE